MTIAYIVSSSFSGSTLLSLVLNAHPEIGTISEFDRIDQIAADPDFLCSCGRRIRQCAFFGQLSDDLRERGHSFSVDAMDMMLRLSADPRINRLLTGKLPRMQSTTLEAIRDRVVDVIPGYRSKKRAILRRNEALMDAVLRIQGARVFLDANKDPYRMLYLSRHHDVRAIYLYKNGVAGTYSYMKNVKMGAAAAAERWFSEQVTICRALRRMHPRSVSHLSYGEMCNDIQGSLERIFELLEVERLPLDGFAEAPHHVIGNRMRLGNFAEIKEKLDWQEKMTDEDKATYKKVCDLYIARLQRLCPDVADQLWR